MGDPKCLGGMPRMRNKRWKRRQSQSLKRREGGRAGRGGQETRGAKCKPSFDGGKEDDEEDEGGECGSQEKG